MHLFIFIDILKSYWNKESHVDKKIMDDRKVIAKKLLFSGFDIFLAQFFFWISGFCLFSWIFR